MNGKENRPLNRLGDGSIPVHRQTVNQPPRNQRDQQAEWAAPRPGVVGVGRARPSPPNARETANPDERDRAGRGAAHSAAPNAIEGSDHEPTGDPGVRRDDEGGRDDEGDRDDEGGRDDKGGRDDGGQGCRTTGRMSRVYLTRTTGQWA